MLRFISSRRFFSAQAKPTIGFIGLGNMGGHMANNLLKHGYPLVVFDVKSESVQRLTQNGAKAAATVKEVAQQASTIVTMLPSSPHVREVYLGANGLGSALQQGSFLIDSSTIDPGTTRSVAKQIHEQYASTMIDAPVSGGVLGAEAGTLTFMVGGAASHFERAKPILQCMGKNIVHCGDTGNGQVAKVCNNLILAISMVGVSEAFNLGVKLGMDPKILANIVNSSSGRCWSSDTYNPVPGVLPNVPSSRSYTGGFAVDLMKKDIGLALEAAKQAGVPLPNGTTTFDLYETLSKAGWGGKDFSSVFEYLNKK